MIKIENNERLTELREQALQCVDDYSKAVYNNDFKTMNDLDIKLKEIETDYANEIAKVVYQECLATDNPIKTAITEYSYNVLSHKDIKENGILVRRELVDDKVRQIDLLKLCKYSIDSKHEKQLDTSWDYSVMAFNQLMCLRSAKELKFTASEIKTIAKTYYMHELAKQINLGGTPDSNTQICKQLQMVIDKILFEDDGKGKNTYKVNNHDIAYILMLYTKKGKNALAVQVAKHDFMRRLISDVLYRIVTNSKYSLEYKQIKVK